MGTENSPVIPVKKPTLTPKAVVYQKFGSRAVYVIEKVEEFVQDGCPGLAIAQNRPCLFRCQLQLPDIIVESEPFKRKKEAEQAAAQMALDKLGIDIISSTSTTVEATDELVNRLSYLFSDEFLTSNHPLSSHMKVTLRREHEFTGAVPTSVLVALDPKLNNLCKAINPDVEIYSFLGLSIIGRSALSLSDLLFISEDMLWVRRKVPYTIEHTKATCDLNLDKTESKHVDAILIPYLSNEPVHPLSLDICSRGYYLDIIAGALGVGDASKILISRSIGKASSEMRLYFSASEKYYLDSNTYQSPKDGLCVDGFNLRASFLSGQEVYGNSILASIGYTWKSPDLFYEDVSLNAYFRLLIGRTPNGLFKLSRESLLLADLPVDFTSRTNWRGLLPRDLLCSFCRQHRLCEPVFSVAFGSSDLESANESAASGNKSNDEDPNLDIDAVESERTFRCEVRLFSKAQGLILEYVPKRGSKNKSESVQHAALIVLSWLNRYLGQLDKSSANLTNHGDSVYIQCHEATFLKEFYLFKLACDLQMKQTSSTIQSFLFLNHSNQQKIVNWYGFDNFDMGGSEFGSSPSIGSMVCIRYSVSLVTEGKLEKDPLENNSEFEFEMGSGAVNPSVELAASQMVVGQTISFDVELPPWEFILATSVDSWRIFAMLSQEACLLKYIVTLLKISEPLEDRMEHALFSPPLSKQRVAFAAHHIMESTATSLIDFGCGSGSLLDALVDCPNTLEMVFGVDISQKGLVRAAKVLHSKLIKADGKSKSGMKSVVLYEGSITTFDPRLYGIDIGTCLEVIEHMEEDQAQLFGDIVLASFCPKILIISTPNYEYNVILQKSNLEKPDAGTDDSSETPCCKFRNHDHKFEWTREQFSRWASDLAQRHDYTVEFSGVGGSGEEPGFASQIAVFKRDFNLDDRPPSVAEHNYEVIWEWNASPAQQRDQ